MLTFILIEFAIVLLSLTIHEAAHAWTANRLGDPTARLLGRMSLNPIVHIDPIGTVLLPLLAAYSGLPIIGWAKPVPVDIRRLRNGRRDFMLVAAAGPLSNIAQAIVGAMILRVIMASGADVGLLQKMLYGYVSINLLLAFFNLVPIPPLDGGNVLAGLLPPQAAGMFIALRQYGFILLYALMLTGVLSAVVLPPTEFFERILLP
ncbi:MAG TPA: site-2 protease family protein [Vicinamibacterales bacterium]|nr:site-2 protease family protein [Vicinamibacterales bacterium]